MKRNMRKTSGAFEVAIDRLVYGGAGLGRREGKVVFVPFSVPGDRLLVRPVEEKKQFIRAEIVEILQPGPGRIQPTCRYFMKCGGCHWQQLEYPRQIEAKRQILEEILHHRFPETHRLMISMEPCSQPFAYRNRARVQLRRSADHLTAGFYRRESHTVEDIDACPLLRPLLNEALSEARKSSGAYRHESDMACSDEEEKWAFDLADSKEPVLLHKTIGDFRYVFSASVFFQANEFIVSKLVEIVKAAWEKAGNRIAIDLYAGVGLFSLPLARQFKKVLSVEGSPISCQYGSQNASEANLSNVEIICSDIAQWMKSTKPPSDLDLVLLDPPRTGAGIDVMEQIRRWEPKTIIYVSCDPQTLSRDIAHISESYKIDFAQGLDMFPQTYHFETVVRLQLTHSVRA
jgi:tRNA/tmRNA/rRNA uracil-C5-methylase (TrmA/RlmC/RlmD family)